MKLPILKNIFSLLAILCTSVFYAQDYSFKNYDWNEKVSSVEVPEKYKNEKEVILDHTSKIEFVIKEKSAVQYQLLHEKIYINSDDAIERNNKIYIPFSLDESVLVNKARVILKTERSSISIKKTSKKMLTKKKE